MGVLNRINSDPDLYLDVAGQVSSVARSPIVKGLEQVKPPKDIKEFEAGEPSEGPAKQLFEVRQEKKSMTAKADAEKGYPLGEGPKQTSGGGQVWTQKIPKEKKPAQRKIDLGTAPRMGVSKAADLLDSMIKGCAKKAARLFPDTGVQKGEGEKKEAPKPADKPPGTAMAVPLAKPAKDPVTKPGSGSHLRFSMDKGRLARESRAARLDPPPSMEGFRPTPSGKEYGISVTKIGEKKSPRDVGKEHASGGYTKKQAERIQAKASQRVSPGKMVHVTAPTDPAFARTMGPRSTISGRGKAPVEKACAAVKKDLEHMAGEYKKIPPPSPQKVAQSQHILGSKMPAAFQGAGSRKEALRGATTGGATGAVKDAPAGVLTSAPSVPKVKPAAVPEKKVASMSKSREAIEILKGMIEKSSAEHSAGNPANEPGRVTTTPHGGIGPDQQSVSGTPHAGSGAAQSHVGGAAHAGSGPAQQSVGGTKHGGSGPAQQSVSGTPAPGNEGTMNKALSAAAMPRMPRAMAMAMDQWRSATNVMTRGNSRFAKHAGAGPLNAEILADIEERTEERTTHPAGVLKACESCGRTYTLRKSDDNCPTCSARGNQVMAKSRGGMLIPAGF
jgi:hypothetical protein